MSISPTRFPKFFQLEIAPSFQANISVFTLMSFHIKRMENIWYVVMHLKSQPDEQIEQYYGQGLHF